MTVRLRDITLGILLLIFAAPVCLLIAVAVSVDSPGPIFYSGARIGKNGRTFHMLKFRTMYRDGNSRLTDAQRREFAEHFKLSRDPRITEVGSWLRRFSQDELPQLINVLVGDMTLVGPRPKLPEELSLYGNTRDELLSVRPGMTGYWQVHRKSADSDAAMRAMDLYYVHHRSTGMDFGLLAATVRVIFKHGNG
jgi:lipopolysaccharide/colanic/teichoic acid biosynthesis glycosyltransferase